MNNWPHPTLVEQERKWDNRFLELAKLVSTWSKDPSTKTGAVIVRRDRTVLSIGFNGFPQVMEDKPEDYENREVKYSKIIHCEMNALLHAKDTVKDCILYTWPFASCDRCVVHMLQAGITRFVFPKLPKELEERWKDSVQKTKQYITEAQKYYTEI